MVGLKKINGLHIPFKEYQSAIARLKDLPEIVTTKEARMEQKVLKINKLGDKVIKNFRSGPTIKLVKRLRHQTEKSIAGAYSWWDDTVRLDTASYNSRARYAIIFHELVHSVGHPERRFRRCLYMSADKPNLKDLAKEELIAELGAFILCEFIGDLDQDMLNYFMVKLEHYMKQKAKHNPKIQLNKILNLSIRSVDHILKY